MNHTIAGAPVICARALFAASVLLFTALLLKASSSFADSTPLPVYKWGARENPPVTDFVYDSFDSIQGARMPYVIDQLPGGTPKSQARPGENCDGNNGYTTMTSINTGTVCAERKSSFACAIPGLLPPYWISQCHSVVAALKCPAGYEFNGTACLLDGKPDPRKAPGTDRKSKPGKCPCIRPKSQSPAGEHRARILRRVIRFTSVWAPRSRWRSTMPPPALGGYAGSAHIPRPT